MFLKQVARHLLNIVIVDYPHLQFYMLFKVLLQGKPWHCHIKKTSHRFSLDFSAILYRKKEVRTFEGTPHLKSITILIGLNKSVT